MGQRNHVLDRVDMSVTWQIRLTGLCSAAMWAITTITVIISSQCFNPTDICLRAKYWKLSQLINSQK